MRLIGLSGYARAGKDTVGEILVRNHGFTRVSFADKLREVALAIDPLIAAKPGWGWHDEHNSQVATVNRLRLSDVVETEGWDTAKEEYPEVRRLLQRLGTEAGRNILGENIWVDAAFKDLDPNGDYVVTDVRFPNEYNSIIARRGELWRVLRPDTGPVNDHPSETALDGMYFHRRIINNNTLHNLELVVEGHLLCFYEVMRHMVVPDVAGRDALKPNQKQVLQPNHHQCSRG